MKLASNGTRIPENVIKQNELTSNKYKEYMKEIKRIKNLFLVIQRLFGAAGPRYGSARRHLGSYYKNSKERAFSSYQK